MTLRSKLIGLHTAFAVFAVGAALSTIYGVQLHVREAVGGFEQLINQTLLAEQLRLDARSHVVELHDVVEGRSQINAAYRARRDGFFTRLNEMVNFASGPPQVDGLEMIREIGQNFQAASQRCTGLVEAARQEDAHAVLTGVIERDLAEALDERLNSLRISLDDARSRSIDEVMRANTQLLGLAVLIGAACVGLVAAGVIVVRRWLILPVARLHGATEEFAAGNLEHRVVMDTGDELGRLGEALNVMATSLRASQDKYRSLFENLRDAAIICNPQGVVVECHDSDTGILGIAPEQAVGRRLVDSWPQWQSKGEWDWKSLSSHVASGAGRIRAVDVALTTRDDKPVLVDIVAYRVQFADTSHAAIVLRDVTERNRLQRLVRQSETMEATVTLARGIAHDFKNLLNSAVTTLSLIESNGGSGKDGQRAQTAIQACQQAARLSRRLSEFADTDQGTPETLCLSETVELILSSLDEPFVESLDIQTQCPRPVPVTIDRDHLTQVILNLVHNARESMPSGGALCIATGTEMKSDPTGAAPASTYAVLTVADSGCGMTSETRERLFEPFFSTKPRTEHGRRGMGLAVVYAAITSSGGFVHVESEVGQGTTFRVYMPLGREADLPSAAPATGVPGEAPRPSGRTARGPS